jgi:hypothetical protein
MLKLEKIMILLLLINSSCLSPRSPRSSYLSSVSVDPEPTELILPTVIADHMVFQESQPIVIWGLAKPEAEVEILFGPEGEPTSFDKKVTRANSKGQWKVDFPPRKADLTPLAIEIKSLNKRVTIRDVLIGELWLAGGQSNMELNVQNSLYGENLIREAKEPSLRIFTQEHVGPQFGSRPSQTPVFSNEGGLWSLGSNEKAVARSSAAS